MHLLVLAACRGLPSSDDEAEREERPEDSGEGAEIACSLVPRPDAVDLGSVPVDSSASKMLMLTNEGEASCAIDGVTLEQAGEEFALSAVGSVVVPPGLSTSLDVSFAPVVVGEVEGQVKIVVESEEIVVPVSGTGSGSDLAIEPGSFDFGTAFIGCAQSTEMMLTNHGNVDAEIEDLRFDTGTSELTASFSAALPFTLGMGESVPLTVRYTQLQATTLPVARPPAARASAITRPSPQWAACISPFAPNRTTSTSATSRARRERRPQAPTS